MGKRVRIDGLSSAITDTLNEYSNHVSAEAKTAIRQAAKTAVKELKKRRRGTAEITQKAGSRRLSLKARKRFM